VNYRHAFHAGNHADVLKHAVLARLVAYLKRKDKAFRVIDTHAGVGLYDLTGEEAGRSPEWRDGIARILTAHIPPDVASLLDPYLSAVRAFNAADVEPARYPGSPALVRALMRPQDRLSAIELHPADAAALADHFAGDHQVRVTRLDGWLALGGHLPPKERRGIVLVDPPFERAGEFDRLAKGLETAHRRFASGVYLLWYPVKDQAAVARFHARLADCGIPRILCAELVVRALDAPGLGGSGVVVVNPPFTLEEELGTLLPALTTILEQDGTAQHRLFWLRGEA
jgi:23S rRNA (adenine2030-N6)-methyltransferase